jgi:peroxiredoxin
MGHEPHHAQEHTKMTIEAGARAPDFSLRGIDGETYSLSDALSRGPVLLAFFKSTCGTCDLAFPYINRLREAYPGDGWSVWAVAQDAPGEAVSYASSLGMAYPVLPDVDRYAVSRAYDPPATPTLYLIDRGGEVVQETTGFSKKDLNSISAALAERLGAETVVIAAAGDGNPDHKPG